MNSQSCQIILFAIPIDKIDLVQSGKIDIKKYAVGQLNSPINPHIQQSSGPLQIPINSDSNTPFSSKKSMETNKMYTTNSPINKEKPVQIAKSFIPEQNKDPTTPLNTNEQYYDRQIKAKVSPHKTNSKNCNLELLPTINIECKMQNVLLELTPDTYHYANKSPISDKSVRYDIHPDPNNTPISPSVKYQPFFTEAQNNNFGSLVNTFFKRDGLQVTPLREIATRQVPVYQKQNLGMVPYQVDHRLIKMDPTPQKTVLNSTPANKNASPGYL